MKRIYPLFRLTLSVLVIGLVFSCGNKKAPPTDAVIFSGKIKGFSNDTIELISNTNHKHNLIFDKEGAFADTFSIPKNDYYLFRYGNGAVVYLRKGAHTAVYGTARNGLLKTYYSGAASDSSNFANDQSKLNASYSNMIDFILLDSLNFQRRIQHFSRDVMQLLAQYKGGLGDEMIKNQRLFYKKYIKNITEQHSSQHNQLLKITRPGVRSPQFKNYLDTAGNKVSLSDFKGKYVYLNFSITGCTECLIEQRLLRVITKFYEKDTNDIAFVTVTFDEKATTFEKFAKVVAKRKLAGTQLFIGGDSRFFQEYVAIDLPRAALIDPKGNIMQPFSPLPSQSKLLIPLLNAVLKK